MARRVPFGIGRFALWANRTRFAAWASCGLEAHTPLLLFTRLFLFLFDCLLWCLLLLLLVFAFGAGRLGRWLLEYLQDFFINNFLVGLVLRLIRGWRRS